MIPKAELAFKLQTNSLITKVYYNFFHSGTYDIFVKIDGADKHVSIDYFKLYPMEVVDNKQQNIKRLSKYQGKRTEYNSILLPRQ